MYTYFTYIKCKLKVQKAFYTNNKILPKISASWKLLKKNNSRKFPNLEKETDIPVQEA